jgi:glycosyltransferase involved in cell wall biosynthesis
MMTDRPLVSIVTPTLNQGRFIEATINSIRAQTYGHFEHIVVDGGSTDGTLDILRRHEGTYNMRWMSEPDGGMYDAINKGMRLASGEILAYLNSDDLYFPWTLETVVEAFGRRPDADVVHGDVLNIDDDTARQIIYFEPPFDRDNIQTGGTLTQPAVFWRATTFQALGGFDDTLSFVGDLDFWIRAGKAHRFHKVNELLAIERNHRGTLREGAKDRMVDEIDSLRRRYLTQRGGGRVRVAGWWGQLWRRAWFRGYWLWFLIQSSLPPRLRGSAWRQLLDAGQTTISRRRILRMVLVPIAGRSSRAHILAPSRFWLEPKAP